jgi:hypothetical protein
MSGSWLATKRVPRAISAGVALLRAAFVAGFS